MKLFLLILGVTLAVCDHTSSDKNVHWDQSSSSQYAFVNGKPVNVQIDPVKIVKDPKAEASSEPGKTDDQNVDKHKDASDPAKHRYPNYYPGNYPYPDQTPYPIPAPYPELNPYPAPYPELPSYYPPYPQVDPGFARPDLWNPGPVIPYGHRNENPDFRLREE